MTELEVRTAIEDELARIAPDVDLTALDPRGDLREQCDIDSMDILNLVAALHQRLGVDIPEVDYPKLMTLTDATDYVQRKLAGN